MLKEKTKRTSKLSLVQLCTAVSAQRNMTIYNAGCADACNRFCNQYMAYVDPAMSVHRMPPM